MDAVPYSLTDSVWGIWAINIICGTRHLVAALRKRLFCRCGCRGWHTIFPVLLSLRWSLASLAEGIWPLHRHDGAPFNATDGWRSTLAGAPMKMVCCLIQIKGDWDEFCGHLGLPTWRSSLRPCFLCAGSGESLCDPRGATAEGDSPWPTNDDEDYERACERCEMWKTLETAEMHARVKAALRYDKRPQGSRGRCLASEIPELDLEIGDRLEPFIGLIDVGAGFDELAEFPKEVLFWRPRNESLCARRCPLFSRSLGVTPTSSLALDTLHTLNLGVMQLYCRHVLWRLLNASTWGPFEATAHERLVTACLSLRAELWSWHEERARAFPAENLTRLTPSMLGTPSDPKLKVKGAECWTFLLFLLAMVEKYKHKLGGDWAALHEAGRCLERLVLTMRAHLTWQLPLGVRQEPHGNGHGNPGAPPKSRRKAEEPSRQGPR